MPTFTSFAEYGRSVDHLATSMRVAEKAKITRRMAEKAQTIFEREVARDLGGDQQFSGWAPTLETVIKITKDGTAILHPTKTGAGPITVAEFGRHRSGGVGGFQGPGVNTRTGLTSRTKAGGVRKTRARKARRWNGYTKPKHTATRAIAQMDHQLPPIAEDGVTNVLRRHFDVET
jgi:hypothetical protein